MSQIFLYIVLIVSSSASAGDVIDVNLESNVENDGFSLGYEKSNALEKLFEFDNEVDVLVSEVDVIASIQLNNTYSPFSYSLPLKSRLNSSKIRAPPVIS